MNESAERRTQLLAEYLSVTSIMCPSCRHDLRGSSGDRCPECGVPLHLRVETRRADTSIWWWMGVFGAALAGIISGRLALAAHEKVIALVDNPQLPMYVRGGFSPNSSLPNWTGVVTLTLLCLLCLAALGYLLGSRRTFGLLRLPMRIVIGVVFFALPLIVLGVVRVYLSMAA